MKNAGQAARQSRVTIKMALKSTQGGKNEHAITWTKYIKNVQ
jgi:hypothetical protein